MKRHAALMWRMLARLGTIAVMMGALVGSASRAGACNVPVFRYALERWQPDPYRVIVFHREPLTEQQQASIRSLEDSSGADPANVVLRLIDIDDLQNDSDRVLLAAQSTEQFPWLAVQYPQGLRIDKTIWAGPLTDEAVSQLLVSPLRTELIRRLIDGQTAVWLMLDCGQADKDDAVAAQLVDELGKLEKTLTLPELSSDPEDDLLSDAPLQVAFSVLRVPRGTTNERVLVETLLGSEPDLAGLTEPMVFPVFGRGRALLPFVGAGITADNIYESAKFLIGACSCEVKELNPGFDLLLAANWDVLLFKEAPPADVLAARTVAPLGKPELVTIPAGASLPAATMKPSEASKETQGERTNSWSLELLGLLVVAVIVAGLAFRRLG